MLTVVDHPLLKRALTTLRDVQTPYGAFRRTLSDVSSILAYEALRSLPVDETTVLGWRAAPPQPAACAQSGLACAGKTKSD